MRKEKTEKTVEQHIKELEIKLLNNNIKKLILLKKKVKAEGICSDGTKQLKHS